MQRHSEKPVEGMSHDIVWLSIKEASNITGRSVNSLNLLVNRHRIDKVKKISGKWHIHNDSIPSLCQVTGATYPATYSDIVSPMSGATCSDIATASIPLEHYEKKRTEWDIERDKLQAGLMMYRWKYEEAEAKMRLLPAPVEAVSTILQQKDQALQEAREAIGKLEAELQQRALPWWKKLWRR